MKGAKRQRLYIWDAEVSSDKETVSSEHPLGNFLIISTYDVLPPFSRSLPT